MSRTPSQREALDRVLADFRVDLHTCFPAQVLAYDAAEQTVDVRPALLREVPSDDPDQPWGFERVPDLFAIPVKWPRAGGFIMTFPISVGDWVEIRCAEQSTLNWRVKGEAPSHPGISDPHGLNGCVATIGWFPDKEKAEVSTTDVVIGKPDGTPFLRITSSGDVVIGEGAGAATGIPNATKLLELLTAMKVGIEAAGGTVLPSPSFPTFPTLATQISLAKAKGY